MATNSSVVVPVDERLGMEKTLRKFKRLCESYGIVREYRKRQDYKKPSVQKKEKIEAAVKRKVKSEIRSVRSYRD
ncbi:MAG: 30S ribosomal protein S21 [Bdellovibrio sp.]|nr:30S ribosomal protein S21 [Bdellovibrio sp.]